MEAFRNLLDSAPGTLSDMYLTYISAMKTGLDSLPKSLPTTLMELHAFWRSFPVIWFLIGHCTFCATLSPETRGNFLLHFWVTYLGGMAGGPLSALLIMDRARAPLSLFASNRQGCCWVAAWWLLNYSPVSRQLRWVYERMFPIKALCRMSVAFMRASMIIGRVNLSTELFPGVIAPALILPTIGACTGKTTHDMLRAGYGLLTAPAEFTVPTYSFRSAFLGTCAYFFLGVLPATAVLQPEEAAGLLISLFVATALLQEVTGRSCDWTVPLLKAVLRVANIPWPTSYPAPAAPAAKKGTAGEKTSTRKPSPAPSQRTHTQSSHESQPQKPEAPAGGANGHAAGANGHPHHAEQQCEPDAFEAATNEAAGASSAAGAGRSGPAPPPLPVSTKSSNGGEGGAGWIKVGGPKGKKGGEQGGKGKGQQQQQAREEGKKHK